jgi:2-polyprenyl-3-methyl-5-hydroxy-6-metoxy-1,4-benzoquinol methylase
MNEADPKAVVRDGYNAISYDYREDDADEGGYAPWIAELRHRLPDGGSVLDLGCGCGVPVSRSLSEAGYAVTGVDFSEVQIERARELVPRGTFLVGDITQASFPERSFDAAACLFALIHVPLEEQRALLARIADWLRPGGVLLITTGSKAWTGTDANWHGAKMWWSHADADTYREWLKQAGLRIDSEDFFPEGTGGHAVFWAVRP